MSGAKNSQVESGFVRILPDAIARRIFISVKGLDRKLMRTISTTESRANQVEVGQSVVANTSSVISMTQWANAYFTLLVLRFGRNAIPNLIGIE